MAAKAEKDQKTGKYSGSVVKTKILDFYNELIWLISNRV